MGRPESSDSSRVSSRWLGGGVGVGVKSGSINSGVENGVVDNSSILGSVALVPKPVRLFVVVLFPSSGSEKSVSKLRISLSGIAAKGSRPKSKARETLFECMGMCIRIELVASKSKSESMWD